MDRAVTVIGNEDVVDSWFVTHIMIRLSITVHVC